jgi:hypothetical protein
MNDDDDISARRKDGTGPGGSGVRGGESGFPTADASALAEDAADVDGEDVEQVTDLLEDADLGDLTIHGASDPDLGLTDTGEVGPDDWAADTGPTRSGESESHGVSNDLARDGVNADGQRIEFNRPTRKRK